MDILSVGGAIVPSARTAVGPRAAKPRKPTMKKSDIRTAARRAAAALDTAERERQSRIATERLRCVIEEERPAVAALFAPLPDEIDISPLLRTIDCRVVLPRVADGPNGEAEMEFYDFDPSGMARGAYGIDEPQGNVPCPPERIDLMVVPGMAFTRDGVRLGRGKGYYDRYIAREGFRARRIGVCFRHQLLPDLPAEPHDRRMDIVVTAEE